jgi:pimeloyl-ACP methyl ester carboxylesterase
MPLARVRDIEMYYEVHGEGFPLVLIRGFGSNADHWYCQVPVFSQQFRVVVFDNRGVGRSDRPDHPYTIPMMAEDTVGLMDVVGIPCAHVLGISMGGMIAQEIALRQPGQVKGVVLACTHCGGFRAMPPAQRVSEIFAEYIESGSPAAALKVLTCLFTERTLREAPDLVKEYAEVSARHPAETRVLLHQWEAIRGHDTWERLARIKSPTLVTTGDDDVLIPPENSRVLAERIPGARLEIIRGGGHQFVVEQAAVFNRVVMEFLRSLAE